MSGRPILTPLKEISKKDLEDLGLNASFHYKKLDVLKEMLNLHEPENHEEEFDNFKPGKKYNRKPILFSSESQEDYESYKAIKTHFNKDYSSDLFTRIMFGSDASKSVVHEEISLSNQLLTNKRKSLIKFLKRTSERFEAKKNRNTNLGRGFTTNPAIRMSSLVPTKSQRPKLDRFKSNDSKRKSIWTKPL